MCGTVIAVDLGIVGRLSSDSRRFLAEVYVHAMAVSEMGIFVGNHNPNPAHTAVFDHFRVLDEGEVVLFPVGPDGAHAGGGGDGGRDLVRDEVEREVERGDGGDHALGPEQCQPHLSGALLRALEGDDLAGFHPRIDPLLAGNAELALSAIRDETGTTIREFRVERARNRTTPD